MPRFTGLAFDQGQIPKIYCYNGAKTPLGTGVSFRAFLSALRGFARDFAAVWGTPCRLVQGNTPNIPAGHWGLIFIDDADVSGALGYHDLTPDGFPLSKIFVATTIDDGELVSVTASHELAEMLVDPAINLGAEGPRSVWYAYETADAVQEETYKVQGIEMTNFVYPSWFEGFRKKNSTRFDHLGTCRQPFEIRPGGWMPVFKNGRWTQLFGSAAAKRKFRLSEKPHFRTARCLHRPEPKLSNTPRNAKRFVA